MSGLFLALPAIAQPALPPNTKVERDMAYVAEPHERQKLDLYVPPSDASLPLIVWVHGGAWRGGDKSRCPALRFLEKGYAVASLNYRLSQHAVFPAQIEDCKAVVRWLRAHAGDYGYDGDRIGVWGASAGGHLVALLGTTGDADRFVEGPYPDVPSNVQCVVDFFGPTDFDRIQEQAGEKSRLDHNAPDSPESQLIGAPITENPEKVAKANPITYITPQDPPFLIVHGDEDYVVPLGQSELLHDALQEAGIQSRLHVVKGGGHGFQDREVDVLVEQFFKEHLKGLSE